MSTTPSHPSPSSAGGPPAWIIPGPEGRLDRFQLGPEIGRGAMGRVLKAWDPMLRRVVALKILLKDDPIQIMHFLREAQLQAGVDHPNVCRVYEVGTAGDQPYIAMQLIEGETLNQLHRSLSVERVVEVMADAASGVQAAHNRGLIHRDIKPSNILLEPQPDGFHRAYIMDFGLARDLANVDPNISWGLVGTPAYMSPEQAKGAAIGPVSDIYSLGATLFAALTGVPPRDPDASRHEKDIRLLRRVRPGISRDLECILRRCLAQEPIDRYPSASALERDLRAWLNGGSVSVCARSPRQWISRMARHQRPFLGAVLAGCMVILVGGGWVLRVQHRQRWVSEQMSNHLLRMAYLQTRLRAERMMSPHDIRPAVDRLRALIPDIERDMISVGSLGRGPGHDAIGRIHLELGDLVQAQQHLSLAWDSGLRSPELASALAIALVRGRLEREGDPERARTLDARIRQVREVVPSLEQEQAGLTHPEQVILAHAHLALHRGDHATAQAICQQLQRSEPWFYEAQLMEAFVLERWLDSDSTAPRERLARLQAILDGVNGKAGSDDRVQAARIRFYTRLGFEAQREGRSPDALFERAYQIHGETRNIRSDSPEANAALMVLLRANLKARLDQGEDTRLELRKVLEHYRPLMDRGEAAAAGLGRDVLDLARIYTSLQARYGEDPRPWLEWASLHLDAADPVGWLENRRALAAYQADLNQDPTRTFESLFARARTLLDRRPQDPTLLLVVGRAWQEQARWQRERGQDPTESLAQAAQALEQLRSLPEGAGLGRLDLAVVKACQATCRASMRAPCQQELEQALGLAQGGRCRLAEDYRVLAKVRLAESWVQVLGNGKADPALLEEGLKASEAVLQRSPASVEDLLLQSELALMAASSALRRGEKPDRYLALTDASLRKGMAVNGGDGALQLAAVRLAAFKALLHPQPKDIEESIQMAARVRQRCPERPEARWLHAMLRSLRGPDRMALTEAADVARLHPVSLAPTRALLPNLPSDLQP